MLTSTLDGAINPTYEWHHNGSLLSGTNVFGETSSTVRFFQASLQTQGTYQLFVSSNMGKIFGREIKVEFIGN